MKKLFEFIKRKFGRRNPYSRCIAYARKSTSDEFSSDELHQINQLVKTQELLNKFDTRKIMIQEPQDLLEMSVEEFDKYFIREIQKLLDIWTKRTRSTAIRATNKPSLLRLLKNAGL